MRSRRNGLHTPNEFPFIHCRISYAEVILAAATGRLSGGPLENTAHDQQDRDPGGIRLSHLE